MNTSKPKILIVDEDSISIMAIEGLLIIGPYESYFESNSIDGLAKVLRKSPLPDHK